MDDIDGMHGSRYDGLESEVTEPMIMAQHVVESEKEWITTGEAARVLNVGSINTVKRWAREGKLHYRQPGGEHGRMQIERASVEKLLHSTDSELLSIQRSEQALDETDALGRDMTQEEMDALEAGRNGKLPWQKST